jgi:hypothetical protein
LWGVSLSARITSVPKDCKGINTLPFMMAFHLDNDNDDELVSSFKNCQVQLYGDKLNASQEIGDVTFPSSKVKKTKRNISYKYIESVFSNVEMLFEKSTLIEKRVEIKKLEQSLSLHNDIFSQIALSFLYIQMDNHALANRTLSSLLDKELFELTFEIFIPANTRKEFLEGFLKLLQKIDTKIKNKKLWDTFLVYLYHSADQEIQDKILDTLDVVTSPIKIRNMSQSLNYGYPYPGVWFPLLKKKFGIILAEKYLETSTFYADLKESKLSLMWILNDYFPSNKEHRKLIWNAFQKLQASKKLYYQDMTYRLLDNESLRIYLMQNDNRFKRPMFVEKRKHFMNLLKRGLARDYALYNLILLGDYNPNYLIYMQ